MAKAKAERNKNENRQKQTMTEEDLLTTARLFQDYSSKFDALASVMREKEISQILVTGGPSVKDSIKRLDKHLDSCRNALGFLVVGEMMPTYSFEKQRREPS